MSQIVDRKTVFSTPWFDVVAKAVAGWDANAPYYSLELDDYVAVLALTESGQVLLVRQYRPTTESYTLELPSGHAETEEPPEDTARRELLEETGYEAEKMELIGCLAPDSGRLGNRLWAYFAPDVKLNRRGLSVESGLELVTCSQDELLRYIVEGHFDHALHLSVILLAILKGHFACGNKALTGLCSDGRDE